jgi:hypothetical protein
MERNLIFYTGSSRLKYPLPLSGLSDIIIMNIGSSLRNGREAAL